MIPVPAFQPLPAWYTTKESNLAQPPYQSGVLQPVDLSCMVLNHGFEPRLPGSEPGVLPLDESRMRGVFPADKRDRGTAPKAHLPARGMVADGGVEPLCRRL